MRHLLATILIFISLITPFAYSNAKAEPGKTNESSKEESVPAGITTIKEQLEGECDDGWYMSCLMLGASENTEGYSADETLSGLTAECDSGGARQCMYLGILYGYGEGVDADTKKAGAYAEKSCQLGHLDGCYSLATMLISGVIEESKENHGLALYKETCKKKHVESCSTASAVLGEQFNRNGNMADIEGFEEIEKYAELACSYGSGEDCYVLAQGYLFGNGKFREKNLKTAISYFDEACRNELVLACSYLASEYNSGGIVEDVEESEELAHKYSILGCNLGDAYSCSILASDYRLSKVVTRDMEESLKYTEKACTLGATDDCRTLGEYYRDGEYVDQNPNKAVEYFKIACKGNESISCDELRKYIDQVAKGVPIESVAELEVQREVSSVLLEKTLCSLNKNNYSCEAAVPTSGRSIAAKFHFSPQTNDFISIDPDTLRVNTLKVNGVDARKNQEKATNFAIAEYRSYSLFSQEDEDTEPLSVVFLLEQGINSANDSIELDASVIANFSATTKTVVSKPFDPSDFASFELGPVTVRGNKFSDPRYAVEYIAKDLKDVTSQEVDVAVELISPELAATELISTYELDQLVDQHDLTPKVRGLVSKLLYAYAELPQRSKYRQSSLDENGYFGVRTEGGSLQLKKVVLLSGDQELGTSVAEVYLREDKRSRSEWHGFEPPIPEEVRLKLIYWDAPEKVRLTLKN